MHTKKLQRLTLPLIALALGGCGTDSVDAVFIGSDSELSQLKRKTGNSQVEIQAYYFDSNELKEVNAAIKSLNEFIDWADSRTYDTDHLTTRHPSFDPIYAEFKTSIAEYSDTWNQNNKALLDEFEQQVALHERKLDTVVDKLKASTAPNAKEYLKRHELTMQYGDIWQERMPTYEAYLADLKTFAKNNHIKFYSATDQQNPSYFSFSTDTNCDSSMGYTYVTKTTLKNVVNGKPTDVCAGVRVHDKIVNHPNFEQLNDIIQTFHDYTVEGELETQDLMTELFVLNFQLEQSQIDNPAEYKAIQSTIQNIEVAAQELSETNKQYNELIETERGDYIHEQFRGDFRVKVKEMQQLLSEHYQTVLKNKQPVTQTIDDISKPFSVNRNFDGAVIYINSKVKNDKSLALVINQPHQFKENDIAKFYATNIHTYDNRDHALIALRENQ
ncbi:hypothetical protein [Vibrio owensii]|uniref:hypothetical protein n=1 Tax=Vibrio owensii TaxID=696485 RepID=UPI0018F231CA|nr:hypothetical protein [Vibrio owensii]